MPKYDVTLKEIEIYRVEGVEADSEFEAYEKALEKIESDQGKQEHHEESDGEYELEDAE